MILTFTFKAGGVNADVASVVVSDPTGSFGVRREDTGATVVADGTPFTHDGTGQYSLTVTEPSPGLTYDYWVEWVYLGETFRVNGTKHGDPQTGISLFSAIARRLAANVAVSAIVGNAIWHGLSKDDTFPCIVLEIEKDIDSAITPKPAQHYDVTAHCYALSPDGRDSLVAAVISSIDRANWTDGNVAVVSTLLTSEPESADTESGNPEQQYFVGEPTFHVIASV